MDGQYVIDFGTFKGMSLKDLAKDNPSYLLWIAGVSTKYSLTKKAKELYAGICKNHPEGVKAAKEFLQGRCYQCWESLSTGKSHFCDKMRARSHYEYHPYGKRT